MNDNRRKLTGILKLLYENTDSEHSMDTYQIMDALESMYHGRPDRKTIDANIRFIIDDLGYGIVKEKGKPNRYRWIEREFDTSELELLVDAVITSKFISQKKGREIITKFKDLTSVHQAARLNREVLTPAEFKSDGSYGFQNAGIVTDAIRNHSRVSFQLATHDTNKNEILVQNGKTFQVSPYAIVWNNDRGYMIGKPSDSTEVCHYRLSRMKELALLQIPAEHHPMGYSISHYTDHVFDMFDGEMKQVQLICKANVMNDLMDKFGSNFISEHIDADKFAATVRVDTSPAFYAWVFSFGGDISIAGPAEVKHEFNTMLMDQLR